MQSVLVGDILERAETLYGDRPAVVDGETRYTYREVGQRIRRLAAGLLGLGLPVGSHIAILANNSHRYYETYFAAHFAGMPLAPLNIRLAAEELAFILRDGDVRACWWGPSTCRCCRSSATRCRTWTTSSCWPTPPPPATTPTSR